MNKDDLLSDPYINFREVLPAEDRLLDHPAVLCHTGFMDGALIGKLEHEIAGLEALLAQKKTELDRLKNETPQYEICVSQPEATGNASYSGINKFSTPEEKIALFRSLFRGREDLYAKRFESRKTGKSGYQPVCKNEWGELCEKPRIACGVCAHRSFEPVTDEVIRNHLAGSMPVKNGWNASVPFVMGIYPLLQNETCHLLALDFDKQSWQEDVKAFAETCEAEGIPAVIERSRSGNGAHVWIFFEHRTLCQKAALETSSPSPCKKRPAPETIAYFSIPIWFPVPTSGSTSLP
jgi:hypothetical protein